MSSIHAAAAAVAPRPPPPPLGRPSYADIGSPTSPRRRDHVPQPPSLTTSLTGLQLQGSGLFGGMSTPTTSLSSPFSQVNPSPYTPYTSSPAGALRGTSPMASRHTGGGTSAYNPQEWVPVARSPQVGAGSFPLAQQQQGGHTRQQQPSDGKCRYYSIVGTRLVALSMDGMNCIDNLQTPQPHLLTLRHDKTHGQEQARAQSSHLRRPHLLYSLHITLLRVPPRESQQMLRIGGGIDLGKWTRQ